MAITSLDGVIAGMQPPVNYMKTTGAVMLVGRFFSWLYSPGHPGAGIAPTPGMAGAALTSYAGQLPFTNGAADQYLAKFSAIIDRDGSTITLYDRLWHNSGISPTTTTAQTINSATWPARDEDGTTLGRGVKVALEVSGGTGAGASVVTISYTNQAGTSGRTGSLRYPYTASSSVGSFYDFVLEGTDTGVRSIQTYTSTVSMTAGTLHLVAYRPLARVTVVVVRTEYALDVLSSGMPKLYDNTVPCLLYMPNITTNPSYLGGQFIQVNG